MGKIKEHFHDYLIAEARKIMAEGGILSQSNLGKYVEEMSVEQEIRVGDTVRVYDSSALLQPYEATVLYRRAAGESIILDVDGGTKGVRQVFDIQCRKISKRLPRILWLKFNTETQSYEVRVSRPDENESGWAMFKEEV